MGAGETGEALDTGMFLYLATEIVECQAAETLGELGQRIASEELVRNWHPSLKGCLKYLYGKRLQTLRTVESFSAPTAETVAQSSALDFKL